MKIVIPTTRGLAGARDNVSIIRFIKNFFANFANFAAGSRKCILTYHLLEIEWKQSLKEILSGIT